MEVSKTPTNKSKDGKVIYASQELIDSFATYEECKEVYKNNGMVENVYFYYYDNSAWNKNEPIGIISHEDACEESKPGCAFIYFDTTIPAFRKKIVSQILNNK